MASGFGADFLCYVTASEHLRHPSLADVREAVITARIAAHAGDLAKGGLPPGLRIKNFLSREKNAIGKNRSP